MLHRRLGELNGDVCFPVVASQGASRGQTYTAMKNRILIDFVDFPGLERSQNLFLPLLNQRWEVVASEYPDYVIFTHEGQRHKLYSCTKIFYTNENYVPDWRQCDFAILSRKIPHPRAFHLPVYSVWCNPSDLVRSEGTDFRILLAQKPDFCAFLTGYTDHTVRVRTAFFHRLNARKKVHSAGTALNNVGYNIQGLAMRRDWLRRHKFYMAFENAEVPGWTTERIIDAFAAFTVPVYWGDPTICEQFNPQAFIHRRDFDSDEACIEHLLRVDADDELYLKYLRASPFHGNRPNKECDHSRLLDFFDQIFNAPPDPVTQRRWFSKLTKWRLVKQVKTHREKGMATPEERFRERQQANRLPPS